MNWKTVKKLFLAVAKNEKIKKIKPGSNENVKYILHFAIHTLQHNYNISIKKSNKTTKKTIQKTQKSNQTLSQNKTQQNKNSLLAFQFLKNTIPTIQQKQNNKNIKPTNQ